MTIDLNTAIATRFDIRETEDGDELRVFHKRSLIGKIGTDDIAREFSDDFAELADFIASGERTYADVEEFLTNEADEVEEGEEDEDREPGSIVPEKYRVLYGTAQNCGDEIALALTAYVTTERATKKNPDGGLDRAKLRLVAEINGIGHKLAVWEDNGLNGGLLRMNTSNVLRGMNRRGERVQIGEMVWEAREVEKPKRKRASKAKTIKVQDQFGTVAEIPAD